MKRLLSVQFLIAVLLTAALGAQSTSPLADAAALSLGGWARSLLLAGAAISMFGYLGGMTLAIPRMVFALARDGFLPRALAGVHPVHRAPQAAIVAQTVLTLALAISGTFEKSRMTGLVASTRSNFVSFRNQPMCA